jgi:hypothetical protein
VPKKANNYAFIDSQNLHRGIKTLGWQLDYRKFRVYLREKYGVARRRYRHSRKNAAGVTILVVSNDLSRSRCRRSFVTR